MKLLNEISTAVRELQAGQGIIVTDDHNRENEGDLIYSAQKMSLDQMRLMLNHTSGIVCTPMDPLTADKLQFMPVVASNHNTSYYQTPFAISIESKFGVTTGVSAHDRLVTIKAIVNEGASSSDFNKPGHIFPLISHSHGVLGRNGHTEATVDLMRLAGLPPVGVLCELMNDDGSMMKEGQISRFAENNNLTVISIDAIYKYRLISENHLTLLAKAEVPLNNYGNFMFHVFLNEITKEESLVITKSLDCANPLVRIHSSCITGDLFGSLKCDCQSQLHDALGQISQQGGMLVYLYQEGRGIGLANKLKAYSLQNNQGLDTIEANLFLGFASDQRNYDVVVQIFKYFNITKCRLISNNPEKIDFLKSFNIDAKRVPSKSKVNNYNKQYILTKKNKMKHVEINDV